MEGPSVLSPSSWEKRRAWARQSRSWRSPAPEEEQEEEEEEEEEEAAAATWDTPEPPPPHLDDVFLEGSASSKIQMWLQECGSAALEEPALPGPCACGTSFEDDLTLGAEALLLPGSHRATGRAPRAEHLSPGHSMASSVPSSLATRASSSISEVLEWWQSDAEEILHNLGFVGGEAGAASRVPPRFFSAPSRANGIDFQLFLRAQVRRAEMEDPCLLLASRFQQVQALAATADAFFCLYSYVSRTPLQRIAPPRPARPCRDIPDMPEPRGAGPPSPGERLKRAVSSLCLYTAPPGDGDTPRGSRRAPPAPPAALGTVPGVPACPRRGGGDAPVVCGGQRGLSPRPAPAGTAWGHLEPSCPHGRGSGHSPGPGVWESGGAPCPAGAAQGGTGDPRPGAAAPRGGVAVPPALCPLSPHASRVWVTPAGPRPEGGSGSWGRAVTPGCHPGATAGAGGHRARLRGGPPALQPPGPGAAPLTQQGPADSFELEEVLSEEEEEEDGDEKEDEEEHNGDDGREEAAQSLHPSAGTRRSSLSHGRSDSSGFAEEPVPTPVPTLVPTLVPSPVPSPVPTPLPTPVPSPVPSPAPTARPHGPD